MIPVLTLPRNRLFRFRCQPHLNSINNMNNEWPTFKKLSSQFGYYKRKLRRINTSTKKEKKKRSKFGSNLNDFGFEKILAQERLEELRKCLRAIQVYSLHLMCNKKASIYRFHQKLVISSCQTRNLSNSIDQIVLSVDCMELVVTVLFDSSNDSKTILYHFQSTICGRLNMTNFVNFQDFDFQTYF